VKIWEIFWRFVLISLLAFGGGAGTPLIEQVAVRETGWIGEQDFSAGIALAQVIPGPVMIIATFIGYRVMGIGGALAATLGVILVPWLSAAALARQSQRSSRHRWSTGFRRGAVAAAVGLFGVTAMSLARHSLNGWVHVAIAAIACVLAAGTRVHPVWILLSGALVGAAVGTR
jgi:chromate transporter